MPLSGGQTFAGYRIIRLVGSGGMGEVYLAEHPRLPRRDALKILPAEVSSDPDYRARFEREADFASKLWHPHIVSVHDRGDFEQQLWISMDYVDGFDAARQLADRHPNGMQPGQVMSIVTAVASALDYAHKQGLLHRDVKPANIMLAHAEDDADDQRIMLADFGIARNMGDISGLTATNMTIGTVAYAAPEQLMGEQIDGRADQYALAATAYHLLTGSQLFPNSNPAVVISRHLGAPPPTLVLIKPELARLDRVLAIALSKSPEVRFRRCADFARALNDEYDNSGTQSPTAVTQLASAAPRLTISPSRHASEAPHQTADSSRRRWLVAAAAFFAVVLLATVIALEWHPSPPNGPKMVSKDDIAKQITTKMTDAQGNKPDSVTCPDALKSQVGAQLNCGMKIKGQDYNVNVTATSVKGDDVEFDMVETVDKDLVATKISEQLTQKVGQKPDAVTCPDDLKGTPASTLRCDLKDGGQTYGVTVTVTDVDAGDVHFDFKVDDQPNAVEQGAGYARLLIKPDDIKLPGDTFSVATPTENPNGKAGVAAVFSNQGDTREIGDTIMILPDSAGAATALDGAKSALGSAVSGGDPQPAAVGEGGTIVQGTSPDGSKSVTVLIFTEGKAFVTLEFDGKPEDAVPPAFATDIGQKQDAAIKSGLAG